MTGVSMEAKRRRCPKNFSELLISCTERANLVTILKLIFTRNEMHAGKIFLKTCPGWLKYFVIPNAENVDQFAMIMS